MRALALTLTILTLSLGSVACEELEGTDQQVEPLEPTEEPECPPGEYPMTDTLGRTVCRGEG